MEKKYTTQDLLHLTKLQRFGSPEMNTLAASAFLHIKYLEEENQRLKKALEEKNIEIFTVNGTTRDSTTKE